MKLDQRRSLRERLRGETRDSHDVVDALASKFDLSRYEELTIFVQAHHLAFSALDEAFAGKNDLITSRLSSSSYDLQGLGLAPLISSKIHVSDKIEAIGVTYVIAGAHLGGRLLAKQVALADDPRIQPLHLFSEPSLKSVWNTILAELNSRSAEGPDADIIVRSSIDSFAVFRSAFEQAGEGYFHDTIH